MRIEKLENVVSLLEYDIVKFEVRLGVAEQGIWILLCGRSAAPIHPPLGQIRWLSARLQ